MAAGMTPDPLKLAIRVYPEPRSDETERTQKKLRHWRRPYRMLVFDTETRTDTAQALTFGSYRYYQHGKCLEEGLFYGDDLPRGDRTKLETYVQQHPAGTDRRLGVRELRLLSRRQFLEKLYDVGYDGRGLIVGFNLPFDLSRLAADFGNAKDKRFAGGFSLVLWDWVDRTGKRRINKFRPRIAIKHIDSKRALKGFTGTLDADPVDLIPEGSESGEPLKGEKFRGHFLDLRTLAFVLTDRGHSLASACKAFGVEQEKLTVERHGVITPEYIDYNRRDVEATAALAYKLLQEYDRFDVDLQETQAYSPASLGKAHLRKMGIAPILERQTFEKRYLGYAQSAFFGGRTSAHIRKVPVPVVYTDFLSMYPTVNSLMGLWSYLTAERIEILPGDVAETVDFLRTITPEMLFDPLTWTRLPAFARVIPDGDILPTRATYSLESNDYQVALNHLYAKSDDPRDGLWYALPDLAASVLLTGRVPRIVEAFAIRPHGRLSSLRKITLRRTVPIDPATQDFFRTIIEERKRLANNPAISDEERKRLDKALKVLANATSYGIFAEMRREEALKDVPVTCYGIDPDPFTCKVRNPERPGEYCFPPLASLITAAARLMLALLERCVTDLGGTYAMEDTDSMAIVATQRGGLIEREGGTYRKNGKPAITALSWAQVAALAERFEALNPYDRAAIPGSVLKIEDDNFDPKTGRQRQLWCLAISAKRYTLFLRDKGGEPALLREGVNNKEDRYSEHGLGHLLNPADPQSDDRNWIAQAWLSIVRRSLGLLAKQPRFGKRVAAGRTTVSSPAVMKPLKTLNKDKTYDKQIKPFNFILSCHVRKLGHPIGADPERFHLIAPYETDPRKWETMRWIDQYSESGNCYRISTSALHGSRTMARVKSYSEVLREYEYHPEAKCADASGAPCKKGTTGLLARRHISIDGLIYIGKESNHLEEVEEGGVPSESDVYTVFNDPRRDEWLTKIVPKLKRLMLSELEAETGLDRRTLQRIRAGQQHPQPKNAITLRAIALARMESKRS
jgi:DNA polymerase type B, organellar and viral